MFACLEEEEKEEEEEEEEEEEDEEDSKCTSNFLYAIHVLHLTCTRMIGCLA